MKYIYSLTILLSLFTELEAQTLDWARQSGENYGDVGINIDVDENGNVYTSRQHRDTVMWLGANNYSEATGLLNKLDSNGTLLWEVPVPHMYQMCADDDGNVYALGMDIPGGFDFDPGPGITTLPALAGNAPASYIVKFNTSGEFEWLRSFQAGYTENAYKRGSLQCDGSGNIVACAPFEDYLNIELGSVQIDFTGNTYAYNFYLLKLDPQGNSIWGYHTSTNNSIIMQNMVTDENNNIYVAGYLSGAVDLDFGPGSQMFLSPDYWIEEFTGDTLWEGGIPFLLKLNANAGFNWVFETQYIIDLAVSPLGNIYCFGHLNDDSDLDVDPGPGQYYIPDIGNISNIFYLKLNENGEFKWAGGINNYLPNVSTTLLYDICLDEEENFYITGGGSRVDYNPGPGIMVTGSTGVSHVIAKYDSTGNFYWVKRFETDTSYTHSFGNELTVKGGHIYSTGYFSRPVDLDPQGTHLIFNPTPSPSTAYQDGFDAFVQKLSFDACDDRRLDFYSVADVSCSNAGTAAVEFVNGNSPVIYLWDTQPASATQAIETSVGGIYNVTVSDDRCTMSGALLLNGPLSLTGKDLQVVFSSNSNFRPGLNTLITLNALNNGCLQTDATLDFVIDSLCSFVMANPSPDIVSGDTIRWNLTSLLFESNGFATQIELMTSALAEIGDIIQLVARISPVTDEINSNNNVQTSYYPVLNSYDPNMKEFYPQGQCNERYILQTDEITTTIHFQNTGNAEAINVFILDTLSADLDLQSLRVLGWSHPVVTEIIDGNILKFRFDNIMLADSATNESLSKGYVIYEVSQAPDISAGTILEHTAAQIYFDLNIPIYTNSGYHTSVNVIPTCFIGISDIINTISIYPNPANDYFDLLCSLKGMAKIELYNEAGVLVGSFNRILNNSAIRVSSATFPAGVYFIRITTREAVITNKVIIGN